MFTLKNIDVPRILARHYANDNVKPIDLKGKRKYELPQTILTFENNDTVDLEEIEHEESDRCYYYLDAHKKRVKMWPNMIDITLNGALPTSTTKPCWYCRHAFSTVPLGCPLRYVTNTAALEKYLNDKNFHKDKKKMGYFETEGIFCSFPCIKRYISDARSATRYKDSASLLTLLHFYYFKKVINIPLSPPWKTLATYGGHLTIDEFRKTFGLLAYVETVNVQRPLMFSSSQMTEEL